MLSFVNDYSEGAHPAILKRLLETTYEKAEGYGDDRFTAEAKKKIRTACGIPDADIYLLAGGTQTNMIVIDSVLKKYEGVIAAVTGHINAHEAGAPEFTGNKVIALPQRDGKLEAGALSELLSSFYADESHEHMVFPGMVYVSHPTEYGTLYTKAELEAVKSVCSQYGIPLYLDGARLGYGLMSEGTDLTLPDIARICDIFYIGGTKVGALCGEAVVFAKQNTPPHFMNLVKKHGGLLAKGRLCGIQFDTLFTDGLYYEISRNAVERASDLRAVLRRKGYRFFIENPTNQIFVILENSEKNRLSERVNFGFWEKYDDSHTVVRFATSWATTADEISELEKLL